jgi:hypothetical protein
MKLHIGKEIEKIMSEKGIKPEWLAQKLSTSRRNLYDILKREELSTSQLVIVSKALKHDFFSLYQDQTGLLPNVVEEPATMYNNASSKHVVMVSVQLDGNPLTADYWIDKIKRLNAALA